MLLVQMLEEILGIGQGLLAHFVTGSTISITQLADGEWNLSASNVSLTGKGNNLIGSIADIVTYGAILVDWVVQALLNTGMSTAVNAVAQP